MQSAELMSLLQIRLSIAECMIKCRSTPVENPSLGKLRHCYFQSRPQADVGLDGEVIRQ